MNKVFTLCILMLLLLSGCAKQTFYFSKAAGETASYQKKQENQYPQTVSPANETAATETNTLKANDELDIISKKETSKESGSIAHYVITAKNKGKSQPDNTAKGKETQGELLQKNIQKRFIADEKPENKNGKIGFILSLVGLGLTLAGLLFAPLFTIGFLASVAGIILSALGLSEIKRNPEQYSNKNKAMAGLVISITSVVLTLLFAFLVILFVALLLVSFGRSV